MQPVDGFGSDAERRVEPKRPVGAPNVVVDRLWERDNSKTRVGESQGVLLGSATAEADECVDAVLFAVLDHEIGHVQDAVAHLHLVWFVAAGAEDRATVGENAAERRTVESDGLVLHETPKAVTKADHLHAVRPDRCLADGADCRVEPRRVATRRQDADRLRHATPVSLDGRG